MTSFKNRIIRAARLDIKLYEEVEADKEALGQAMAVVVLSSLATGVGGVAKGWIGILISVIIALISWYVWAYLTYLIGTKLLPEPQTRADHGQLLRTIGFSSAPGILRILGIIPVTRRLVFFVTTIWMLMAMVVAVRQALDYKSTFRAVGVCIVGWIVQSIILWLLFSVMGGAGKPV